MTGLDIPSAPVIHDHHAKDVFVSLLHWYRLAQRVARTNKVGLGGGGERI